MTRVRPIFLLALLIAGGVLQLRHGARQGWFVGTLGSDTLPHLKCALWWGGLGLGFGLLGTGIWAWPGWGAPTRRIWIGGLLTCALMVGGSQLAREAAIGRAFVVVNGYRWNHESDSLSLHLLSAPGVARARARGDLDVSLWAQGSCDVDLTDGDPKEALRTICICQGAGSPSLRIRKGRPVHLEPRDYDGLIDAGYVRVPVGVGWRWATFPNPAFARGSRPRGHRVLQVEIALIDSAGETVGLPSLATFRSSSRAPETHLIFYNGD